MNMFIISKINKILQRLTRKIPQIDISIQQQELFLNYRQNWKTLFYFIVYIYINIKPNIHFNLQHDISDPTFCASDPKPPKIKKPFNVFNFQNYYFTLTRVWRRSKEVKGQKDEVDHH